MTSNFVVCGIIPLKLDCDNEMNSIWYLVFIEDCSSIPINNHVVVPLLQLLYTNVSNNNHGFYIFTAWIERTKRSHGSQHLLILPLSNRRRLIKLACTLKIVSFSVPCMDGLIFFKLK